MRTFQFLVISLCSLLAMLPTAGAGESAAVPSERPNILLITVDDMNADSIGAFGCRLADTSPTIDRLAGEGLRFEYAHVQVGNCMPSRNVMWSGRYPHNNGVEGFYQVRQIDYPVLADLMKRGGYFTAIRGKVNHSTPYHPYDWDLILDTLPDGQRAHIKDAESYGVSARQGIQAARDAGKPFCLMINVSDPHKPFYAEGRGGATVPDQHVPSRVFTPDEVPIPGFLFDDPVVRKELAHYYSSVRRADDCVRHVLAALVESGQQDRTVVMFFSDHGMPLPFAKTQLYHHSTRTPLIVRWPGITEQGKIDQHHMVSAVDFLPTLLDIAQVEHPAGLDGVSFLPLLRGQSQDDRNLVFKEYNENSGASRDPMRAVQSRRFLYLFNPWSNGQRVMATATSGTPTYRRLVELAESSPTLAKRLDLYRHRVVEEFYDVQTDPDCLNNLVNDPDLATAVDEHRRALEAWMQRTGDGLLTVFQNRHDGALREQYPQRVEKEAEARRQSRRQGATKPGQQLPGQRRNLISLVVPESVQAGQQARVAVQYRLPDQIGTQSLAVTLKAGRENRRVERQIVSISGSGQAELDFAIPASVPDHVVRIAAFVGADYQSNLQHLQSDPIPVTSD